MINAPEQIWAFYAPHISEDENGATIVAYETAQHGSHKYIRADIADKILKEQRDRFKTRDTYSVQKDIEAEGQRAAVYYNNKD